MSEGVASAWDFLSHPAFAVFEDVVRARLAAFGRFPEPHELSRLARGIPNAVAPWFDFAPQDQRELDALGGYDRAIASNARIPTRIGSYHDLLGALIWLHFPATKTALHRIQLEAQPGARAPRENAATLCDESGVLVLSRDPSVFEALLALDWVDVFWTRRASLAETTRFLGFGHGLLDALRSPHPLLMAKALFVHVNARQWALSPSELRTELDAALALRVISFLSEPARLAPLPVLGVPGWASAQCLAFYEDTSYFQTARKRARPPLRPAWLDLTTA
jgi:Protein of unknown function (DUF3025)